MRRLLLAPAIGLLAFGFPVQAQQGPNAPLVITSPALGGQARPAPVDAPVPSLPTSPAARTDERVNQLEELVRQLTGKVEEANFKIGQLSKQLERIQADSDLRFKDLETKAAQPAPPVPDLVANGPTKLSNAADGPGPAPGPQVLGTISDKDQKKPQAAATPKDPQAAYDAAYALAEKGDYDGAETGFQAFLKDFPKDKLAGNAQYWLGDIAYARKDFDNALKIFADSIKKYPKHPKAPDMLFKLGASFGQLGMKNEACKAFQLLFSEHPNMPDRIRRAATAEKQKRGCAP